VDSDQLWTDAVPSPSSFLQPGFNEFWVDRLRVLVEVLSRLVVRLDGEQAIAAFS